jgi:hypothetical protein
MAKGIESSHICGDMNSGLWIDFPVQNYAHVLSFLKLGDCPVAKATEKTRREICGSFLWARCQWWGLTSEYELLSQIHRSHDCPYSALASDAEDSLLYGGVITE